MKFYVCALLLLISVSAFAQERLMVMQDVVYPYKSEQYEQAQKDMNKWIAKNVPGVSWTCLQRENYTYTYIFPVTNYAQIDEINKMWQDKMKTIDQAEFEKYSGAFNGTIAHTNQYMVHKVDKASYVSENPYTKKEDNVFVHWDYFEVIPGMESAATKILEDEANISKKTKMGLNYNCWRMDFGENTSSFLFATWGKDRVSFFADIDKDNKLGGKELEDTDKKFMAMVQKFDHWNGKLRKDLSIESVALLEEKK